jgi:hypothetical protein
MHPDFFDQLDADLAGLTRAGAHLTASGLTAGRTGRLMRRGVVLALAIVALAASLVSEFPASASGHVQVAQSLTAPRL